MLLEPFPPGRGGSHTKSKVGTVGLKTIPFQLSETFMSEPDEAPALPHGSRQLLPEGLLHFPD